MHANATFTPKLLISTCNVCAVRSVRTSDDNVCDVCATRCCYLCGCHRCRCNGNEHEASRWMCTDLRCLQRDAWMVEVCPALIHIPRWYAVDSWMQRARMATLCRCMIDWKYGDGSQRARLERAMVLVVDAFTSNLCWSRSLVRCVVHCLDCAFNVPGDVTGYILTFIRWDHATKKEKKVGMA